MREYRVDLLTSDMSWRRFCALYANLSPRSATYRSYERVARRWGITDPAAERSAWELLTGLAKPRG